MKGTASYLGGREKYPLATVLFEDDHEDANDNEIFQIENEENFEEPLERIHNHAMNLDLFVNQPSSLTRSMSQKGKPTKQKECNLVLPKKCIYVGKRLQDKGDS